MDAGEADLAGRRTLVIEDETMVSMLIEDTLAAIGCEVVAVASHFDDAMNKAKSLPFDAAILDVNLSGQQTFPIAVALAKRGLRFVFATGYGATSVPAPLQKAPVLQKLFQQKDLERALRAAFDMRPLDLRS